MRGYFESEFPFDGHFGPRFGPMGGPPLTCPFRGDFPGHHGRRPGFGPFGRHGFDHSPERRGHDHHGPEHHRRGPSEDGHRGDKCGRHASPDSDNDGPAECHCHGPPGFRGGPGGRPYDSHRHGPSCHFPGPRPWFGQDPERHCFGRRGPCEGPWRGPWEGPWGAGHPMHGFGRFGHRRPCPYSSDDRPSRYGNCEKCRENEPCCSRNKENQGHGRGRKENGPCQNKDKDQNPTSDTVFVQRIILEKATRPQSV